MMLKAYIWQQLVKCFRDVFIFLLQKMMVVLVFCHLVFRRPSSGRFIMLCLGPFQTLFLRHSNIKSLIVEAWQVG